MKCSECGLEMAYRKAGTYENEYYWRLSGGGEYWICDCGMMVHSS